MDITETKTKQEWLLSTKERKYLHGEDINNKNKRKRSIENKRIPNLANRIQAIIDDVVLLKKGEYLQKNDRVLDIEDFHINPRFELRNRDVSRPCFLQPEPPSLRFGMSLGHLAELLAGQRYSFDSFLNIWGYILGLIGNESNYESNFQVNIHNLIEFLENMLEERRRFTDENPISKEEIMKTIVNPKEKMEKTSFPIRLQLIYLERGDKEVLQNNKPSILNTITIPFEESRKYLIFEKHLRSYTRNVTSASWNQISGDDIFYELWNADKKISSVELKKRYNNQHNDDIPNKGTVSKICADLAGQDRDQRYVSVSAKWDKRPLVNEVDEDRSRGRNWETTSYGDVVGRWSFTDQKKEIKRNIAELVVTGTPKNQFQQKINKSLREIDDQVLDKYYQ
jgi:hypothetical protein